MTDSLRRSIWLITLGAFLTAVSGCATTHVRPLDEELARPDSGLTRPGGQKIKGYQLRSEEMTEFRGWARIAEPDSLGLWLRVPAGEPDPESGARDYLQVAGPKFEIDSVQALWVMEPAPGRTAALVATVAVGMLAALFAYAMSDLDFKFEDPQ